MSYGLAIYNDGGDLVIDGDYQNHFLVERRSLSVTFPEVTDGSGYTTAYCFAPVCVLFNSVIATNSPPFITIRHLSGRGIGIVKVNGTPGNWYGFDVCTYVVYGDGITITSSLEYEVYIIAADALGKSQAAGYFYPSSYGILINNAQGSRVFDSRMANLAIENVQFVDVGLQGINGVNSNNIYSWTAERNGTVLAVKQSHQSVSAFALTGVYGWMYAMKVFLEGNNVFRHVVVRSPSREGYGPFVLSYFGCHEENNLPLMFVRRQSL